MTKPEKSKQADVFAIHGVNPEVLAYAMAKYSRSSLSMKESIAEISSQKASDFLHTFYFQYGHRSIADLAHVPMALENISLLAAIEVEDEQRWDGQERSTRYQDFSKREHYTPAGLAADEIALYREGIKTLFDGYEHLFRATVDRFHYEHPKPEGMDVAQYERTIRARAFDVARSLLPLATLTSVGQITSARTLEGQISRLLASPYGEVCEVAARMKKAATGPSFNARGQEKGKAFRAYYEANPEWGNSGAAVDAMSAIFEIDGGSKALAPTLVKHTEPDTYRARIREIALEALKDVDLEFDAKNPEVATFIPRGFDSDTEIIATILYEHCHIPFLTLYQWVGGYWHGPDRGKFIEKVLAARGRHDELPRAFRAVGGIIFDIRMDIGGFRDLHRHRRVNQFFQPYGGETVTISPLDNADARQQGIYDSAMLKATRIYFDLRKLLSEDGMPVTEADFLLPLGVQRRFLMKMDLAEVAYIAELRTQPAGHISYRRIAWSMYQELQTIAPAVAAGIADRVTDPSTPLDFFKR